MRNVIDVPVEDSEAVVDVLGAVLYSIIRMVLLGFLL